MILASSRNSEDGRPHSQPHSRLSKRRVVAIRGKSIASRHRDSCEQHRARALRPKSTSPTCETTFFPPITFLDLAYRSRSELMPPICPQYSSHGAPPRAHIDRSAFNTTSCHQIYCVNIRPLKSVAENHTRKIRSKINAEIVAKTRPAIQSRKSMNLATSTSLARSTNLATHARTRDAGSTRKPQPIKRLRRHASDTA